MRRHTNDDSSSTSTSTGDRTLIIVNANAHAMHRIHFNIYLSIAPFCFLYSFHSLIKLHFRLHFLLCAVLTHSLRSVFPCIIICVQITFVILAVSYPKNTDFQPQHGLINLSPSYYLCRTAHLHVLAYSSIILDYHFYVQVMAYLAILLDPWPLCNYKINPPKPDGLNTSWTF